MNQFVRGAFLSSIVSTFLFSCLGICGTVFDLQKFKTEETVQFHEASGAVGAARLINLNSNVRAWYLLEVKWPSRGGASTFYNLEVPDNSHYLLRLSGTGLVVQNSAGQKYECTVFSSEEDTPLNRRVAGSNFAGICEGTIYVKSQNLTGNSGGVQEWGANFLRDHFGAVGEVSVEAYKNVRLDATLKSGVLRSGESVRMGSNPERPQRALLSKYGESASIAVDNVKIDLLDKSSSDPFAAGEWYSSKNHSGVYVSLMRPALVNDEIMQSYLGKRVNRLDSIEANALVYLVAFDLGKFTLGWSHGTHLPGVSWSKRNPARAPAQEGPDGFGTVSPLSVTGQLNPAYISKLTAVMCGGFQRYHGVFKFGEFANTNFGNYYGFVENGVVLSRLNVGLETVVIYTDGTVDIKTWTEADNANLSRVRFARQNGVALVEPDPTHPTSGPGIPGALVYDWGRGNWSGSAEGARRSARGGACISQQNGRRYLIYGYFSDVNPDSMARVFQAYQCQTAIHLDMNSPGQAYLGLFNMQSQTPQVEMPLKDMFVVNTKIRMGNKIVEAPRYVGSPDNSDFFYILRK